MSDPIGSFSGLSSGVQWRDMVDQIMAIESRRRLTPLQDRRTLSQARLDAWDKFQGLVTKFRDAARGLRDSSAFASFRVSGGTSASSGRTLVTATAGAGANPGTHSVEVLGLARANKLSGNIVASASSSLGISGEFAVNGQKVTVAAADTLAQVRDKINALNAGANATGVTASILTTGSTQHRLILTADQTGARGIELVDDSAGTLQTLGVTDGTRSLYIGSSGGAETHHVSSATAAVATMLGVSWPPPSTIEIGGRTITVDLTVDSLSAIAARIAAAGGNASVVSETQQGKTTHRLVTSDTVSASTVDGQRTLEVLGFVRSGRGSVTQVVESENTYTDAGGANAAAATLLSDLRVSGNALGLVAGDTIAIQGKRGDGSAVSLSLTIGASDTMQTLVNRINDATSGFGAGTRPATASLAAGRIVLTDGTSGDSQLALSLTATRAADGSVVNLGRQLTSTVGRQREVSTGADAIARVDGVVVQRNSNTFSDAIAGVTLSLQQAEVGTTTTLTLDRDVPAIAQRLKDVATAYNELLKFRTEQQKEQSPLRNNATLRGSLSSLTGQLLSDVTGLTGSFKRAGLAGLALQADGTLSLDQNTLQAGLINNFGDLVTLFTTGATSDNGALSYFTSTAKSKPGSYAVDITQASTVAAHTGTGFSGTYVDDGTADTLTITDASSGISGNISLANGDTIDAIVTKLNTLFTTSRMSLQASKSGNELVLTGTRYGSNASFTVAYTAGGTDGTAQLGFAAATYAGLDVAGTIGGLAATGSGQVLTGASGGVTEGLSLNYTGTTTGAVGTVNFTLGVSGMLTNAAEAIVDPNGGIEVQRDALDASMRELQTRADTVQQSLDRRRQQLVKQFVEMERAISRIQAQGTSLSSFITSLQPARS
ncbi:MAG: flagellar filament capping protein FliD [Gemmatimonadetes bacterium]|nr:flagellar filament capping protein FliD [Gemmatimonadota bacterium]